MVCLDLCPFFQYKTKMHRFFPLVVVHMVNIYQNCYIWLSLLEGLRGDAETISHVFPTFVKQWELQVFNKPSGFLLSVQSPLQGDAGGARALRNLSMPPSCSLCNLGSRLGPFTLPATCFHEVCRTLVSSVLFSQHSAGKKKKGKKQFKFFFFFPIFSESRLKS